MKKIYRDTIQNNVNGLLSEGELSDRRIVIFGCNKSGEDIAKLLGEENISCFVDNDEWKQGDCVNGIPVHSPEEALKEFDNDVRVLIGSRYFDDMSKQLQAYGYQIDKHIFNVMSAEYSCSESDFELHKGRIKKGVQIIKRLRAQLHGADIYVFPMEGLGDIYRFAGFLDAYRKKLFAEKLKVDDRKYLKQDWYVIVPDDRRRQVIQMFDIQNVILMEEQDLDILIQTVAFLGRDHSCGFEIISEQEPYSERIGKLANYKGIDFAELIAIGVFGLNKADFKQPRKGNYADEVRKIFEANDWEKGKVVVMAPYANSVRSLPKEFWEKKSEKYQEAGYTVITNISDDADPVIRGTEKILIPLYLIRDFVEYAGFFEGLRSGLCDVIESVDANKAIYHYDDTWNGRKVVEYWGMQRMGSSYKCRDIVIRKRGR